MIIAKQLGKFMFVFTKMFYLAESSQSAFIGNLAKRQNVKLSNNLDAILLFSDSHLKKISNTRFLET